MTNLASLAEVVRVGVFDLQVCVPAQMTDEDIVAFANRENPAGTDGGWSIRREGSKYLSGDPERNPCDEREGCVHVMLDC